MEYKIEALNCPNCGAPLDVKPDEDTTFCLYCNSSIHINKHEETGKQNTVHTEIPEVVFEELKKLISSGNKDQAVELYKKTANVSEEVAAKQIALLTARITNTIVLSRPLTVKGILVSLLLLFVTISAAYIIFTDGFNSLIIKIVCWTLMIIAAFNLASLGRSIVSTVKFAGKVWTDAAILKYFFISKDNKYSFYKLLLEVKATNESSFRAETNIMIKNPDVPKLQEGKIIKVKYLSGEKDNVVASIENLLKNT